MGDVGGRRLLSAVAAGLVGIVGFGVGGSASASTQARYPVVWSFLATAVVAGARYGPDVPPPGANVAGCKPSAAH
ncbi:MAG TPA: hypothetical protein VE991_09140, partial [Acidimicrobiales bacterium]|nr:hypothetical protein [Acidimicrobiales bacterium]